MKLYYGMEKSPYPGPSQQKAAYLRSHDFHVVKSLTDGHREVIGHHGEKDDAHSTKEVLSEELDHAAFLGDGSALREGVYDQLGGNDGRDSDIQKGQGGKEKIHG